MKVETTKIIAPVKITLETQEEIDLLFSILNFVPITQALEIRNQKPWDMLYNKLSDASSEKYMDYHWKLDRKLKTI